MSDERMDPAGLGRAAFLRTAGLTAGATWTAVLGGFGQAAAAGGGPPAAATTPAAALQLLVDGSARFQSGHPVSCGPETERMVQLGHGQNPSVIVLGCSDSRVPQDTIFDQKPGNVFSIRVAGNFVTSDGLGSIEYGVVVLKAPLIVVLGHASCGAVHAAVDFVKDGTKQPGHIQGIVEAIAPAAKAAEGRPGTWLDNAIEANVRANVAALTARSSIVADAVKAGSLGIVGGVFDISTSHVRWFKEGMAHA
jgi:carbonic anhydrase